MVKRFNTLMVEDDARFRKAMKELLISKFPSMHFSNAADGREAFRKIEKNLPDLIIMDIELPGESGLVLTKKIKNTNPHVIIIILTNHDLPEYREAALQNGADYFFSKETTKSNEIVALIESVFTTGRLF